MLSRAFEFDEDFSRDTRHAIAHRRRLLISKTVHAMIDLLIFLLHAMPRLRMACAGRDGVLSRFAPHVQHGTDVVSYPSSVRSIVGAVCVFVGGALKVLYVRVIRARPDSWCGGGRVPSESLNRFSVRPAVVF